MRRALYPIAVAFTIFMATSLGQAQHTEANMGRVARDVIRHGQTAPFPPGFLGHPLAYAAALFGQLMVFSFAVLVLFLSLSALDLKRDRAVRHGKLTRRSLINIYRIKWILMMTAVCFGTGGNLLTYLTWGEVNSDTMMTFLTVEKIFKFLACVPFLACVYLIIENDEAHAMQLSFSKIYAEPIWPIQPQVQDHLKTVAIVLGIAVLVTFGKASGLGGA
jgi:hypothetical protein